MNMMEFLQEIEGIRSNLSDAASAFLDELIEKNKNNPTVTENGRKIIQTMRDNEKAYLGVFTSKQIGEILFMPARSVSGAMRKLIAEQYVEKKSVNPIAYALTDKGKTLQLDNQ